MRGKLVCRAIASLLCAAVLLVSFAGCSGRNLRGLSGDELREHVAMETEHYAVSGSMYAYFFFTMGLSYVSGITQEELDARGFDENKPFYEQMYDEEQTWYDYINEYVVGQVETLLLLCEEASEAGVTLGKEDYAYINENLTQMRTQAVIYNQTDFDTYLKKLYFGYVNEEDFQKILLIQTLAAKVDAHLSEELRARMTQERVDAQLATMTFEGGRDETLTRNLGHILVSYENYDTDQAYDNIKAAKKRFEEAGKTKEAFEAQWKDFSEDSTMIYDSLQQGEMITEIDTWLFAPERQVGDVGIVTSESGCHLLYYMADADPVYVKQAKEQLSKIIREEMMEEMRQKHSVKVHENVTEAIDV